jgi:glutamine---fructose-6-phosphate transaminase (isomerizing)
MSTDSFMLLETKAAPAVVARLLEVSGAAIDALADQLQTSSIRSLITVARGSSDHAAAHFAYSTLTKMGLLVTSLPPSAITLYDAPINTENVAAIAFSQSGQSPDLVTTMQTLRRRGALTAAFINDIASPLALGVQHSVDLAAGLEGSVAATKSFISQLVAGQRLVASWACDDVMLKALDTLPVALERAVRTDWSSAIAPLVDADRMFVIARGASLPIAAEMALKLKEVCGIQAEAFSAAEVKHGPMALIESGYPLLVLAPRDRAQADAIEFARYMRKQGAKVLLAASPGHSESQLPISTNDYEILDGVCAVQSFYVMAEALARARGLDPDKPPRLSKVTRTR